MGGPGLIGIMEKELLEECRFGWLSVESDFSARLDKPELLKYGRLK